MNIEFQLLSPDKLASCASVALAALPEERRSSTLFALSEIIERGHQDRLILLRAVSGTPPYTIRNQNVHAAAIAILGEDRTANLLALNTLPAAQHSHRKSPAIAAETEAALLYHLHQTLVENEVYFVQAVRTYAEPQPSLQAAGYQWLADLQYACRAPHPQVQFSSEIGHETCRKTPTAGAREGTPPRLSTSRRLSIGPFELTPYLQWYSTSTPEGALSELASVVQTTYVDSQDCPQINAFQTASDSLHTYMCTREHNPNWWFVATSDKGAVIGVLLLTPRISCGLLEITYMGVTPEARRTGLGDELLRFCLSCGWEGHFSQVVLAYDRSNTPAQKLYKKHSFELTICESIWGAAPRKVLERVSTPPSQLRAA